MEKSVFRITINAPREKVWAQLWGAESYPKWTAPFSEGSKAETDWKQGSKVLFLNGQGEGMVSRVAEVRENEFMSIEHLGMYKEGVEDYDSEAIKGWAGAHEDYALRDADGGTELTVTMDIGESERDFLDEVWPKAFNILKELSEK